MGKGRPRAVEKGVPGHSSAVSSSGALNIPQAPVFYPTEEEFKDPLEFIYKIRPEAEPYGICRIVPPKSWKPPFALDLESFTFPTKTQAIHQLQARVAACDPKTFELEYNRFLEYHSGKRQKKRVVFEGEELDLCKLFNAVKRYGGYDKVVKEKKWAEVFRFVRSVGKISECSKHVLCQLYREHLYDYEVYHSQSNHDKSVKRYKKGICGNGKSIQGSVVSSSKKRRRNSGGERTKVGTLEKQDDLDQICEQCRSGLHGEVMLLCDRCNKGWHIYCLSPPLKKVPPGNWYCLECVNSDKDSFGFVPGKHFSLDAFRRLADRAKRKWFGSACVSRLQIEKRFWEIVEGSVGEVEVLYGSDLDTSIYGSGFPRVNDPRPTSVEVEVWNEYCASPWNLNNLPKLQGSVLRAVHHNIAGVMVPWLYIGMLFSSFCWHFEDHCFYSMNYLHWGEPKCWYSVPGSEAHSFEQVMKNCLPDLFDAQPDLLFQLVTMLNPSVLQENGVPVYSVLQEPGNFVITFPRSYHGGFNFGLNCAEAVNFAPADWLPHGGFGAELYRSYHKAAVLSHEELLYVVAKGDCGSKVSPFLKKELLRVFSKEKTWRERLWRDGIICTSPMTPRRHPEYVGTEEDPSCIICQQYLFLSAVVCSCRPSAFVCLEHWEHLCECSPSKHRLLYRHTLAELNDLVLMLDKCNLEESPQNRTIRKHLPSSNESNSVMKKIRGGHATHVQLAEQWVLNSHKILQAPFSSAAYVNALKDAEQFLWGGSEMDQVRNMAKNLIEARKWAEEVINCLSKVETCLHHCKNDIGKVSLGFVENLLNYDPLPCNEPGYFKLKAYAEDARILVGEIESALSISSHVSIAHLGKLYSRASELPVYVEESTKLAGEISSAKVWSESVRQCITEKRSAAVDIDVLYKLKSEMLELRVELPETELLLDLLRNMESWQIRCSEILKGPISLKELEVLLQELNHFSICVPELKLLRQYHNDAVTWISHFHNFIVNARGREDQKCVVQELTCILEAGKLLRVQVDELPFVEEELKKACCREKALQACATKMPLDFIEEVIAEAVMLQIDNENIFVDVSRVLAAASSWEERSKHILGSKAQMSEFEDAIRISGTIFAILPSLNDIEHALSMAKSWISNSQPFLLSSLSAGQASSSSLKVDALKDLVAQSKFLKVDLQEPAMLLNLLNDCEAWQNDACTLLECTTALYSTQNIDIGVVNDLTVKIEKLLTGIKSATTAGLSLGFDFYEIPKLQNTSCILQWCLKAFSFCSGAPLLEDVERLMKDSENLCATFASSCLGSVLIKGARWLWEALSVFPHSSTQRRCKLSDVEEVLEETQRIEVPFPIVAARLVNAIEKHKSWQEQVHAFFNSKFGEQSWSVLVQLKELGESNAFSCPELDLVASEINKVENWFLRCKNIIGPLVYGVNPLLNALIKIKHTLDGSLYIYGNSKNCEEKAFCACCCSDVKEESIACVTCKDCYHPSCLISTDSNTSAAKEAICPFCLFMESGTVPRNGDIPLISKGKRPELNMLIELSNAAKDLHLRIDEKDMIQQLVEKALACKACLSEIVDSALAHSDKDLRSITEKLLIALKAVSMAGIYDKHGSCNLELAIERNKWKIRVKKLLENSQKPLIQQIHRLWKEGLAISIPSEDQFMKKLVEVKSIGMIWADRAKKVAMDSGALGLDKVFKLITEGENLPVYFEKELKLLRARSALHCICRKPYDQRAMIACNRCDEWYHFDCVNLHPPPPKTYLCPACEPCSEEAMPLSAVTKYEERLNGFNDGGPRTPPPRLAILRKRNPKKVRSNLQRKILVASDLSDILRCSSEIDYLWWRNRKPLRRTARKRARLDSLSSFLHI